MDDKKPEIKNQFIGADRVEAEEKAFIESAKLSRVHVSQIPNEEGGIGMDITIPRWSMTRVKKLAPLIQPVFEVLTGVQGGKLFEQKSITFGENDPAEFFQSIFQSIIDLFNPIMRIIWMTLRKPEDASQEEIDDYFEYWLPEEVVEALWVIIYNEFIANNAGGLLKQMGGLENKMPKPQSPSS